MNVYIKKITSNDNFNELKSYLDDESTNKINKLKNISDQKRSIVSKLLLKDILKLNKISNDLIIYNEYGKPYLKNNEFFFNISHCEDYVVLVTSAYEVGIDIQKIQKTNHLIVNKKYQKEEQDYVTDDEKFTRVWTLKESYLKAIGKGLYEKLESFSTIKDLKISPINNYQFYSLNLENYCLSVCYKKSVNDLNIFYV